MKAITIGRNGCDIVLQDASISRKHATVSLVDGQYVYQDMSKNGTVINGRIYHNEKIVLSPGTPVFLANKVQLPWPQVLMLLPNSSVQVNPYGEETVNSGQVPQVQEETIGIGWGILSFIFPLIGFILYFVWNDSSHRKAKQAASIAGISIAINFAVGFIGGFLTSI